MCFPTPPLSTDFDIGHGINFFIFRVSVTWMSRDGGKSDLKKDHPYSGIKWLLFHRWLTNLMRKQAWAQGLARHTLEETINFGLGDLRALSTFLGK